MSDRLYIDLYTEFTKNSKIMKLYSVRQRSNTSVDVIDAACSELNCANVVAQSDDHGLREKHFSQFGAWIDVPDFIERLRNPGADKRKTVHQLSSQILVITANLCRFNCSVFARNY